MTLIKDLITIPDRVHKGDFVQEEARTLGLTQEQIRASSPPARANNGRALRGAVSE